MNFVQRWTFLELQKSVDHLLAVVEDRSQLLPAAVARSNDGPRWNRLAGQLGRDRPAEEAVTVKHTDRPHVTRVEANRHLFPDISSEGERKVAKALEMDAVAAHLACTDPYPQSGTNNAGITSGGTGMHEVRVIARAVAQQGKGDEVKAVLRGLGQPTRAEAG